MLTMGTIRGTAMFVCAGLVLAAQSLRAQEIAEVVVTAQKRSASISTVPLSIAAISGDTIKDMGWDTGADALSQVPNVQLDPSDSRASPQFRIRGVGSEDFNVAGQSPVGVYINEVYINNSRARGVALYDLDRVEVLRGPQGTLWGKNTTAGAIHFVTKKPGFDTDGYAQVKVGTVDGDGTQRSFEGAFGGAMMDGVLAGRIATKLEKGDNWIKNLDPSGQNLGGFQSTSVRGSLLWKPAGSLDVELIGTYTDYVGTPTPQHPVDDRPSIYGYVEPAGIGYNTESESHSLLDKAKVNNVTLTAEWRPGEWTLNTITAYNGVTTWHRSDDDNSPVAGILWQTRGTADQFSEELRLTSPANRPLRGIFGAYAFGEHLESDYDLNFGRTPFDPNDPTGFSAADIFGHEAPVPGATSLVVKSIENRHRDSQALFASADYDITRSLDLSAGIRWTRDAESIRLQLLNYWLDHFGTLDFGVPGTALGPPLGLLDTRDKTHWNEPSGDVTLKWKFGVRSNVYFRYARGYRAGQYNITNTQPSDFSLVNPEFINAYEFGLKTALLDNRLQVSASVFDYRYSDIQVYIFTSAGGVALLNGNDARMRGGEIELNAVPIERLQLKAGVGYTHARYGQFVSATYDRTGNVIPNTPRLTWNLLAQYSIPVTTGAVALETDLDHRDNTYADADNTPLGYTGGRTLANASATFESDHHWLVRAWVRNLTNKFYNTGLGFHPVVDRVSYGMPRTYGLTVEWRVK